MTTRPQPITLRLTGHLAVARDGTYDAHLKVAVWRTEDRAGAPCRDEFATHGRTWQESVSLVESWIGATAAEYGFEALEYDVMGWEQMSLELEDRPS